MNRFAQVNLRFKQYQALALAFSQQHKTCPKWLKQAIRTTYNECVTLRTQQQGA